MLKEETNRLKKRILYYNPNLHLVLLVVLVLLVISVAVAAKMLYCSRRRIVVLHWP